MRVLVVAAHPDDDAIGCGGAIRQHSDAGDEVHIVYLTSGELGCGGIDLEGTQKRREDEVMLASQTFATKALHFWRWKDQELPDHIPAIAQQLRNFLRDYEPTMVYAHHEQELHSDHAAAGKAVRIAIAGASWPLHGLYYEVWTPLPPPYDVVKDITPVIGYKIAGIRAHRSQCERMHFDEAALALARYHGELHNRPHGPYAEVFNIIPHNA